MYCFRFCTHVFLKSDQFPVWSDSNARLTVSHCLAVSHPFLRTAPAISGRSQYWEGQPSPGLLQQSCSLKGTGEICGLSCQSLTEKKKRNESSFDHDIPTKGEDSGRKSKGRGKKNLKIKVGWMAGGGEGLGNWGQVWRSNQR